MSIDLEIANCINTLREGGIIIFPNETGWCVSCDLKNDEAVSAMVLQDEYYYPVVVLNDSGKFTKYVKEIPEMIYDLIEYSTKPLNLILEKVVNVPLSIIHDDSCSFRIPKDPFTAGLLGKYGKPLFAVQLKNQSHPARTNEILHKKCYVVNLRISPKANIDSLIVMRFTPGGKMEFIKK